MTPDNIPTYSSTLTPEEIANWGFMPAEWIKDAVPCACGQLIPRKDYEASLQDDTPGLCGRCWAAAKYRREREGTKE